MHNRNLWKVKGAQTGEKPLMGKNPQNYPQPVENQGKKPKIQGIYPQCFPHFRENWGKIPVHHFINA
jgi:hypothetical protein